MRACRLVRVEAPLYLALSASSPFLDGEPTGFHSTRWHLFPQTPDRVPLFESHAHFIRWTEEQLELGTMQNVRHLWSSVRPNGDCRPYNLNRLELRICDPVIDPLALLAITALLEARLCQLMDDPSLDPLTASLLPTATRNDDLLSLTLANEMAVARHSLDASLRHWQDGRTIKARDWIAQLYAELRPIAKERGFSCFLSPLQRILREGNAAQQWLQQVETGHSCQAVVAQAIQEAQQWERDLADQTCQGSLVA
jgi:predicted glutamate--cysteine ligase